MMKGAGKSSKDDENSEKDGKEGWHKAEAGRTKAGTRPANSLSLSHFSQKNAQGRSGE